MAATAPAPTEEFSPQTSSVTAHVNAMFTLKWAVSAQHWEWALSPLPKTRFVT